MPGSDRNRWCLLIHSLPTRPLYLRARIRRLVADSGAAPIRKAVYALPMSADSLERLGGIAAEIEAGGGAAFVCEATFPDDAVDRSVIAAYNDERRRELGRWMSEATAESNRSGAGVPPRSRIARLRARYDRMRALDRFDAAGVGQAAALMAHLERGIVPPRPSRRRPLGGLTWVTRRGLHVDRLACAWLVRRFVDPSARFRFTANPGASLEAGEIGFDMPEAEISHEAGGCSAETLARRAGIDDRVAMRLVEIVHDIDIGDGRYRHAETAGFQQLLLNLIAANRRDEDRLARGIELYDGFYAALSRGGGAPRGGAMASPGVNPPPRIRLPRSDR